MFTLGMQRGQTPPPNVLYTHGDTVTIAGEIYLIAYKPPEEPLPTPEQMRGGRELPRALPPTEESEVTLSLLNIRTMGDMLNIHTFELTHEMMAVEQESPMRRQALESTLKDNLRELRNAIEQFQADTGAYPARLLDLVATTAPKVGVDLDGHQINIPAGCYKGPYLEPHGGINNTGIPLNPFVDLRAVQPDPNDVTTHWAYKNALVHVAAGRPAGQTQDGIPINQL